MPKLYARNRWAAAFMGLCLLCLSGCDLPDLFSDPETKDADFVFRASGETAPPVETELTTEGTIFVYVVGEVMHPGVYELTRQDRLEAAIRAAGGFTDEAEPASVNLARSVNDGEQVVVLSRDAFATAGVSFGLNTEAAPGMVNINTADQNELATLPGIGQTRAQAIIAHRNKHGPFEKIEDIMQVSGIKQAAFEQIRDLITTGR